MQFNRSQRRELRPLSVRNERCCAAIGNHYTANGNRLPGKCPVHHRFLRSLRLLLCSLIAWAIGDGVIFAAIADPGFRPPSVPLVACDPYFSIWSPADKLNEA